VPAPRSAPAGFRAGELVEYHSVSAGGWVRAKVLAADRDRGTYNLDCKSGVTPDKIRRPEPSAPTAGTIAARPAEAAVPGSVGDAGVRRSGPALPVASGDGGKGYSAGELVEYFSASQGGWILTRVVTWTSRGTYDLECKQDAPPEKVRKARPESAVALAAASTVASTASVGGGDAHQPRAPPGQRSAQSSRSCESLALDSPVQLLRVERRGKKWWYEVCPDGAKLLERQGARRRIAVASITGLYRTGKSFILNLLLERLQRGLPLFQVGSTTRACTEGLWLWGSISSDDPHSPLLAFVDCEGFGSTDGDRTRDAHLMTLCALLSSVLVLNTKGALSEGIFNALALTCRFAEHVEERGNEASRPNLLWVLRDFQLDLLDPQGRPISPSDYLEQALHAAPLVGHDQDRGQAALEVRQSLLKFFAQRSCFTLVRPAIEEEQLQRLETMPYQQLRPEFRAGVEALRGQLITACRASPKAVGGQLISCTAFVALLRQLVTSMNENEVLSVKGAWEMVQHNACETLVDELRSDACAKLRRLSAGESLPGVAQLPLSDEALRSVLQKLREDLRAQWNERAVGDEAIRSEYWQELEEALTREEAAVKERNARLADRQLSEACAQWLEWLANDSGTWESGERVSGNLTKLMEKMPSAPLCRAATAALEAAGRRVAMERQALSAQQEHSAVARGKELDQAQDEMKQAQRREQEAKMELKAKAAELRDSQAQHQAALADAEAARAREHDVKAMHRALADNTGALQADLERLQAAASKAEADRLSHERAAEKARSEAGAGGQRCRELELQLEQFRAQNDAAVRQLEAEAERRREETEMLRKESERARKQLEEELRGRTTIAEREGSARIELERQGGELRQMQEQLRTARAELQAERAEVETAKAEVAAARATVDGLKSKDVEERKALHGIYAEKEAVWRADMEWAKTSSQKSESKYLASERAARKARWEADTAAEERRWLEAELARQRQGAPPKPEVWAQRPGGGP